MTGAKVFRAAEGRMEAPSEYCVAIELRQEPPKRYFFCVQNEEELTGWIDDLTTAAALGDGEAPLPEANSESIMAVEKEKALSMLKRIQPAPEDLFANPPAALIRKGPIGFVESRPGENDTIVGWYAMLFTSTLVLTQRNGDNFDMKAQIKLSPSVLVDVPESSSQSCKRGYSLLATGTVARDEWVRDILKAIAAAINEASGGVQAVPYVNSELEC